MDHEAKTELMSIVEGVSMEARAFHCQSPRRSCQPASSRAWSLYPQSNPSRQAVSTQAMNHEAFSRKLPGAFFVEAKR
jgi:hypothetical protein